MALDRYLSRHPDHAEALITRARTLQALAQFRAAAVDYSRAIERLPGPIPTTTSSAPGRELAAREINAALAGLDAGMARLGPIPALQISRSSWS